MCQQDSTGAAHAEGWLPSALSVGGNGGGVVSKTPKMQVTPEELRAMADSNLVKFPADCQKALRAAADVIESLTAKTCVPNSGAGGLAASGC